MKAHLIPVPAVEPKYYKDSRSKVKSNSRKVKTNPHRLHLTKEQRTCHTRALSSLYEEKLETDVLINSKATAKIEAPTFKENKVRLIPDIWCQHTLRGSTKW